MSASEHRFRLRSGLEVAARIHRAQAPHRVLAVHGWLDNAASFDALAAHLPECAIVAIDLIGHGRSDHRPAAGWYHLVDNLDDIVEVLDQLGWDRSVWLGHSLGGALLTMLAAAMPERVDGLVLIESGGPLGGVADTACDQLRRGLDDRLAYRADRPLRLFADKQDAAAARCKVNGLSPAAALTLVERGLRAVDGGYRWSTDPRLTLATPLRLAEDHVRSLLGSVACPVLLLLADPALPFMSVADRDARLACLSMAERHVFPGHHHLHMETPAPLAERIAAFLGTIAARRH